MILSVGRQNLPGVGSSRIMLLDLMLGGKKKGRRNRRGMDGNVILGGRKARQNRSLMDGGIVVLQFLRGRGHFALLSVVFPGEKYVMPRE